MLRNNRTTNIKYYRCYRLMQNRNVISRVIQEIIWVIDAKESEKRYAKKKLACRYDFVDADARNVFKSNEVTPNVLMGLISLDLEIQW